MDDEEGWEEDGAAAEAPAASSGAQQVRCGSCVDFACHRYRGRRVVLQQRPGHAGITSLELPYSESIGHACAWAR